MGLDIRIPIGMIFVIIGGLLTVYGVASDPAIYAKSLGTNVNLLWGATLLVFGAVMWFFGRRGAAIYRRERMSQVKQENQSAGNIRRGH
jgi:hypothetical protein